MKKIFSNLIVLIFFLLVSSIVILSTIGFKTNKFNKFISEKIIENDRNIFVKLDKIKFKFDIKELNLFLETNNPQLTYKNLKIPTEDIKVYLDFVSLIKSKPKINKLDISLKEININELKKIIIKTKPSSFNSLITNKIKNGKFVTNLELYFDENLDIKNFIARGEVKEMDGIINENFVLKDTTFNFFADNTDILITNVKSNAQGFLIKDGNLKITRNKIIKINSDFSTEVIINKKNINNYSAFLRDVKYFNESTNFIANLSHNLNIDFDQTFKVQNYTYTSKGKVKELSLKFDEIFKNSLLSDDIRNLSFKDSSFNIRYSSDEKNNVYAEGKYSIDGQNYRKYNITNNFSPKKSNIKSNFEFDKELNFNFINYKKKEYEIAEISLDLEIKKNSTNIEKIEYTQNKNLIVIEKLKIDKKDLISLKKLKIKTYDNGNLNNDFTLNFGKKIKIFGNKYDATNLNKFVNQKSKGNNLKKINKDIEIDLKTISTPLSKKLKNFKLLGVIRKGQFIKISSKGDFGNNKFLDISMKTDKNNKKKYLEIYSDLPQPLLSEYNFFKGLSDGVLTFSSIIEKDNSTSKLVINDFKVINAPGVVKLLSLADFGGLADLAEGDGLSFEKMEINMNINKGFLRLEELYAVGPSISVLMEGYKETSGLTSLRGTLVPAKNLNKLLSKIPVIGNIIIPKQVGEGLFGVSFKMKGPPGKIKTTINPIKTLTPRFITKALEKSKKAK